MPVEYVPEFVVFRDFDEESDSDFLYAHPSTGEVMPGRQLGTNPNNYPPEHFSREAAQAHVLRLNASAPDTPWVLRLAPRPCPSCGRVMWANDLDFLHPRNRLRDGWRAGCNVHDFGCGFEIEALGVTRDQLLDQWNRAQIFSYPDGRYVEVERLRPLHLKGLLEQELPPDAAAQESLLDPTPSPALRSLAEALSELPAHRLHFVALQYLHLLEPREA